MSKSPFVSPSDYPRIKIVDRFEDLVSRRFEGGVNALCWPRDLPGDFAEVVERLGVDRGITALSDEQLRELSKSVSDAGRVAIEVMLDDLRRLRELELQPELNAVNGYVQREQTGPVRTDVCSFHVDSATAETDTWLCTYRGASSELLRNDEAVRKVEVAEIRAALRREWWNSEGAKAGSGEGNDGILDGWNDEEEERFREWLSESCYDLHYAPIEGARPISFGVGNLWRIATEWPGGAVPPCIHRAPDPIAGGGMETVRLLLIA